MVRFERRGLADARPPKAWADHAEGARGLLIVNPPYGERLGEGVALFQLYETLGDTFKQHFGGFDAWVLAGNATLVKRIGLKAKRRIPVWNGPIECRFLQYPLVPRRSQAEREDAAARSSSAGSDGAAHDDADSAQSSAPIIGDSGGG